MNAVTPRILLQCELARRCAANPSYSLRAFARSLGMNHSVLSLVISGKRPLSKKAASILSERLPLTHEQRELLVRYAGTKRRKHSGSTKEDSRQHQVLTLDAFTAIAEWYHLAILSLLELPNARYEARWISAQLGIQEIQARMAMERLERLELVTRTDGRWMQATAPLKVENTVSTPATRKFHQDLLDKAKASLENDPIDQRDHSSTTFAMSADLVPHAIERIRAFRRELTRELEAMKKPGRVYHLSVQLFPLSQEEKKKEENP